MKFSPSYSKALLRVYSFPSRGVPHAAYTLFEIMLVLGIISILVGSAIYLLVGNLDAAKEQRVEADIQAITTQLKTYEMLNYTFPTTAQGLQALVTKPTIEPIPRRWRKLMDQVPLDPWGTPYQYAYPGRKNPNGFDLYSLGPDRVESSDDLPRQD
jgi:general secretion pathway protein G